jgi:hypothetical protein
MNIFVTSLDPKKAASHLDDLRLNKMILETAQLLSTAYRHLFGEHPLLYKNTHYNHPCSIWARKNIYSYSWLVRYFDELSNEKMRRDLLIKNKDSISSHKSWQNLYTLFHSQEIEYNNKITMNFFTFNCTEFKNEKDLRIAYQKQLMKKWQNDLRPPKWSGAEKPNFNI